MNALFSCISVTFSQYTEWYLLTINIPQNTVSKNTAFYYKKNYNLLRLFCKKECTLLITVI